MIADSQGLVKRQTIQTMVRAFDSAAAAIRESYGLIHSAMSNLDVAFQTDHGLHVHVGRDSYLGKDEWEPERADAVIEQLRRQCWRVITNHMEIRRVLSKERCQELDKQLETGEGLPPITERAIVTMFENTMAQVPQYLEESVIEVYKFLRRYCDDYKTSEDFGQELGKRVVLRYCVEIKWGGGFHANYHREAELRMVDNIFHALAGQGTVKTRCGPLVDGINATERGNSVGETEFFRFKCFKNGNLHLEFKRMDLVQRMNAIVSGGTALKGAKT